MDSVYDDLARRTISRLSLGPPLRNGQLFVGIGGGPGSGKSTLSAAVRDRINGILGEATAVVLPMDGFHHSREELAKMAREGEDVTYEALLSRRGAPWTFDAGGCVEAFVRARETGSASLPVYCRKKSDPVTDGVALMVDHRVVLLEGNYLLAFDDPGWAPLVDVFDEKWYVACESMDVQRERLIHRHLETWTEEKTRIFGKSGREGAAIKADSNDVKNACWVDKMSRHHADLIVVSK